MNKSNVDVSSWLKSPSGSLVSFKLGPHMGPEWWELRVVRGAADSAAQFVLICPLGEASGEISWILLQMFHCVCMLGIGAGPLWSKWKRTTEVLQRERAPALLAEPTGGSHHLRIFPGFPPQSRPSVIRDLGTPQPAALIRPSPGTACNHLANPSGKTETRCQRRQHLRGFHMTFRCILLFNNGSSIIHFPGSTLGLSALRNIIYHRTIGINKLILATMRLRVIIYSHKVC